VTPFAFMLCADDYALSPGVSSGILEAIAAGRLNATSVMTNRPSWPRAAADLRPYSPAVAVGLHFTLTLGAPLGPMPVLAPDGRLPPLGAIVRGAVLGRLPLPEIRAELARQLDAFEDAFGRAPDYVDGHQHVHALPGVRGVLLDELSARGLAGKTWLRDSADRARRIVARRSEIAKAVLVALLGAGFATAARERGFSLNEGFAGFSAFAHGADQQAAFSRYLAAPGARHLVMCHPGRVDAELALLDPVTRARENELDFLLSPAFERVVSAAGARLGRWDRQD
jgi:predicted glycoside hydrolase/deacetylase ChbG (UPF0249 family)